MDSKIYVGNVSFGVTEDELRELFSKYGEVESVKIVTDAQTGRPRGFGFVEMASEDEAKKAIKGLNGTEFKERTLTVSEARPPKQRDRGHGRGGFGGRQTGFGGRPGRGKR
ncbi:MAG: RNA-binding protein [Nitrospirota bacterium]